MARPTDDPKTERIELRFSADLAKRVDDWRRFQPDIPSRSEAMRRLVENGLKPELLIGTIKTQLGLVRPGKPETYGIASWVLRRNFAAYLLDAGFSKDDIETAIDILATEPIASVESMHGDIFASLLTRTAADLDAHLIEAGLSAGQPNQVNRIIRAYITGDYDVDDANSELRSIFNP